MDKRPSIWPARRQTSEDSQEIFVSWLLEAEFIPLIWRRGSRNLIAVKLQYKTTGINGINWDAKSFRPTSFSTDMGLYNKINKYQTSAIKRIVMVHKTGRDITT